MVRENLRQLAFIAPLDPNALPLGPQSLELEHLLDFSGHFGRALRRVQVLDELRAKAGA